jgi:hypothetical protein
LIYAIGLVNRHVYDTSMDEYAMIADAPASLREKAMNVHSAEEIVRMTCFFASTPHRDVSRYLCDAFFASKADIMVPWLSPPTQVLVQRSQGCYLPAHDIDFSLPSLCVVPHQLYRQCRPFFEALQSRRLIQSVTRAEIEATLSQWELSVAQLIALLVTFRRLPPIC